MQTEKITERTTTQDGGAAKGITSQHYLHNATEGALVPLLKSFITGVVIGLPISGFAWAWGAIDWWVPGMIAWLVVQAIAWLVTQTHIVMLSIWALENFLKLDITGDGVQGNPNGRKLGEPWGVKVTLRNVNENGHISQSRYISLQGEPVSIFLFVSTALKGGSMAERVWMGDGKPFSPTEFRENMRILKQEKLVELKNARNENDGFKLTAPDGVRTFEEIRDQYMAQFTPPPSSQAV